MKQRAISLFAALCLALALQLPALAADYPDMPAEGSWSYEPLTAAVENGLLQGTDGLLQPGGTLTRAQLATILVRAFGATEAADAAFTDVSDSNWFAADVSKAVAMGVLGGSDGKMRPNDALTRQETFVVLARALCLADGTAGDLSAFSDAAQVSGWAAPSVAAMVNAGYVSGSGGALNPQGTITRAEFAQVMYNIIGSYITEAGTYTTVADGTVLVRAAGNVNLQGVTVDGDLILGDGAGSVTLDNVTVTGRVLVRGGDENAVRLVNGSTAAGGVVVREEASGEAPAETPTETVEGEPVTVTTAEEFIQALSDPKCSAITVSGGIELPAGSYTINKPVTTGGLDNFLKFSNAQVVNNSAITVLPYEVTDEENGFSGLLFDTDYTANDVSFTNNGTLDIQADGIAEIWGNTFVNEGGISNDGSFAAVALDSAVNRGEIVNNGTLMFPVGRSAGDGAFVSNGTITNEAGATITSNGYLVVSWGNASLVNKGTITSGGGISIMRPVENSGTITFQGESYNEIYSIAEASDGQPHVAGLNNTGTITIKDGSTLDIQGNGVETHAVNAAGATIALESESGMALLGGAAMDNQGTITIADSGLNVGIYYIEEETSEPVSEVGTLVNNGTITDRSDYGDQNHVSVQTEGSVLTNNGTISAGVTVWKDARLENQSGAAFTGNLEIGAGGEEDPAAGTLVNDGTITIGSGHYIGASFGSTVTNNGTITVEEGGSWWIDEASTLTGGEIVDQNPAGEEA